MQENIETICLAGCNYLITNPEIIKVQVIKKKFVDQMPDWNIRIDDPDILETQVSFLGKTEAHVVCKFKSGFKKILIADLLGCYYDEMRNHHGSALSREKAENCRTKATKIIDDIPQLFLN